MRNDAAVQCGEGGERPGIHDPAGRPRGGCGGEYTPRTLVGTREGLGSVACVCGGVRAESQKGLLRGARRWRVGGEQEAECIKWNVKSTSKWTCTVLGLV